jgi:DNA-directed RNA polymerase specialized sigma54-like protein
MTKFRIIISQGGNVHLTRRNATISQKFTDKEECKSFLVTIQNLEPIGGALEGLQESLVTYEDAAKRANLDGA